MRTWVLVAGLAAAALALLPESAAARGRRGRCGGCGGGAGYHCAAAPGCGAGGWGATGYAFDLPPPESAPAGLRRMPAEAAWVPGGAARPAVTETAGPALTAAEADALAGRDVWIMSPQGLRRLGTWRGAARGVDLAGRGSAP